MSATPEKPWPPVFRVVRQPKGSYACTACVAAMVLGMELEEVQKHIQGTQIPNGKVYYKTSELIRVLGNHGVVMGFYFKPPDDKGMKADNSLRLTLDLPIEGMVCIMAVKSQTQTDADHLVLFNGREVLDPQEDDPQPLRRYTILEIYPIIYFKDGEFEGEKPAAPPEIHPEDLRSMAQCLMDNPSWDNLLCGKYGRVLAHHYLHYVEPGNLEHLANGAWEED